MMNCLTDETALQLYREFEKHPQTTTVNLFSEYYNIQLYSIFLQGSKSVLINALEDGIPKIFKIPLAQSDAQHEGSIGTVFENDNCSNLVPLRYFELEKSSNTEIHSSTVKYGLLMPMYAAVISQFSKVSLITISNWINNVLTGINCLHSHELCHGDIKPTNIFLKGSGEAVLGDYGAVTKFGLKLREYSQAYMPLDYSPIIASQKLDYYLLAMTALELLGLWNPINGRLALANIRYIISNTGVINIFQDLL